MTSIKSKADSGQQHKSRYQIGLPLKEKKQLRQTMVFIVVIIIGAFLAYIAVIQMHSLVH